SDSCRRGRPVSADQTMAKAAVPPRHRWRFYRAGGVDQVRLDTGADIVNLHLLDQKLWVALSCPVRGLEFDERTLELLDTDADGHVRAPEILAAIKWLADVLRNPDELVRGKDGLPLAAIDSTKPEGKRLLASARHILASLGRKDATTITVADAAETGRIFAQARCNGDGIVPPDTIDDPIVRRVAEDAMFCLGSVPARSGTPGSALARAEQFFADAEAYAAGHDQLAAADGNVLPLGPEGTAAAWRATEAVRAKIDDFFARCRLAAFDPRAAGLLKASENDYAELADRVLTIGLPEVRHLPIAPVEGGASLPFGPGINPAWADEVEAFRQAAVVPLLGKDHTALSEADWSALLGKLAAYGTWQTSKAGASVEKLGIERVREILASNAREALRQAIEADAAVAPEIDAITSVEKLVRLHRDLHHLLQ